MDRESLAFCKMIGVYCVIYSIYQPVIDDFEVYV